MKVLGIETSCDETGVGIIDFDPQQGISSARVLAHEIASSVQEHVRYGGVVPEIASRAHLEAIAPTVRRALATARISQPDAVAVTIGPGLVGALLIGVATAKAFALAWQVPLYALNHLVGHIAVDTLEHGPLPRSIALLVSGGHTHLLLVEDLCSPLIELGGTIDDAAGEAFDKVARVLGLGYPGGPAIDALAVSGDPHAISFPRALSGQGEDFSFSGLKTSVARYVQLHPNYNPADVAASFQEAVADILSAKAVAAAQKYHAQTIVIGGGATANNRLRALLTSRCADSGMCLRIPSRGLCTDNGVMIAALAVHYISSGGKAASLTVQCDPNLSPTIPALNDNFPCFSERELAEMMISFPGEDVYAAQ